MANIVLGKDYNLEFEEPYTSPQDRARLTAFFQRMFDEMPALSERLLRSNELHGRPVTFLMTSASKGSLSPASVDYQENKIYFNPDALIDYGVYDKEKECVVNASVVVTAGHELDHLSDKKMAQSPASLLRPEELARYNALLEYLRHDYYLSQPPDIQAVLRHDTPNIDSLSQETRDFFRREGLEQHTNRDLEKMLVDVENIVTLRTFELSYVYENNAARSEADITHYYPNGVFPDRGEYMNFYHREEASWPWQRDQGVQASDGQWENVETDLPKKADWCDSDEQPSVFSLPSSFKP